MTYTSSYEMTGFQSACAEFAEKPLSLDERYLQNHAAMFIVEAATESKALSIKTGDKLLIDRSQRPREGQMVLLVLSGQFKLALFSRRILEGQDPETGDFVWGVVTASIREYK